MYCLYATRNAEAQVQSQSIPCGIFGRWSGTGFSAASYLSTSAVLLSGAVKPGPSEVEVASDAASLHIKQQYNNKESKKLSALLFFQFIYTKVGVE
jgi:hypothetical protein